MTASDYASRDDPGSVAFYVLLWKRKGISLESFSDYWRNVHGPVCARLPGQFQYWQFHVGHNETGIWPTLAGVEAATDEADQFDGIAELTFRSAEDRQTWFTAAAILMSDEHNIFRKAVGYVTAAGHSKSFVDAIESGDPNGGPDVQKFHTMVRKADGASVEDFRGYLSEVFAPAVASSELISKFRLHLFEAVDNSRPDAAGVSHFEPVDRQYQAAFEIAFRNRLTMERFFASQEYAKAIADQASFVKQMSPFPERNTFTFVYDGRMTLAGQRSSTIADLIVRLGATNQVEPDITELMLGQAAQS